MIGDRSFTIGSATDHVYALLNDQLDSGQTEQAVQVKAGESRSIEGTIVEAPSDMNQLMSTFQLTQQQADELKNQGFYIAVAQTATAENNNGDMPTGAGTE